MYIWHISLRTLRINSVSRGRVKGTVLLTPFLCQYQMSYEEAKGVKRTVPLTRKRSASPVFLLMTWSLFTAILTALPDPTITTAFFARVIAVYNKFLWSIA